MLWDLLAPTALQGLPTLCRRSAAAAQESAQALHVIIFTPSEQSNTQTRTGPRRKRDAPTNWLTGSHLCQLRCCSTGHMHDMPCLELTCCLGVAEDFALPAAERGSAGACAWGARTPLPCSKSSSTPRTSLQCTMW